MAKKIKKQLKRSMPLFIIFSLIMSTMAVGLVFNLNFKVISFDKDINLDISQSLAKAQTGDTATTTVTVKNASPTFSVEAAENPVSTSTSPINVGYGIGFNASANDPENNSYYLIVCDQAGVTASSTGGAPSCDNDTICVSTVTNIAAQASCASSSIADPGSEIQEWYAYICDNHGTEAECSTSYSQGADPQSGDSSSPYYINHAPSFTAVTTTVDDRDPGDAYTITASVTDGDVTGEPDELHFYVCQTNDWATSTGCGGTEFCHATSTSADVVCNDFATTTPARDDTFTYYAFVKDSHELVAALNPRTNTYTVNNVAPQVGTVVLNSGNDIVLNLATSTSEVVASTTASITDNNGCSDIQSATSTIYWSSATGGYNCSADDDDCYPIGSASCEYLAGSCTGSSDVNSVYICTTTISFHAIPTDDSTNNPNEGTWWMGAIGATDESDSTASTTNPGVVEVMTSVALDITEQSVPFGSIRGGNDSVDANATTTVINIGNSPIDTTFQGIDMVRQSGGGWIGADQQEYSTSTFTYGDGTWTLASTTASTPRDLDLAKPTTATTSITDAVYWGINIPAGKVSGVYDGTDIFRSSLDSDAW